MQVLVIIALDLATGIAVAFVRDRMCEEQHLAIVADPC